jgi:ketosteroid isomerase-like protein
LTNANQGDAAGVRRLLERSDRAYSERDLEAFVNCFSDDIVVMPPDREPIVGIDAWRAMLQRMFAGVSISEWSYSIEEIVVADDWAFERHFDSAVYTPNAGGESRHLFNKGVFILRRQPDGARKIARYVWNSNPAPSGS